MCKNPHLDTTDWDWAIDPIGLEYAFRDIYTRYNKPLMITENGLGAFDELTPEGKVHDEYRISYLRDHIKAIKRAMEKGVEVWAYCPWSALDLLSTSNGVKNVTVLSMLIGLMMIRKIALVSRKTLLLVSKGYPV